MGIDPDDFQPKRSGLIANFDVEKFLLYASILFISFTSFAETMV